jgi:hypothetical protein
MRTVKGLTNLLLFAGLDEVILVENLLFQVMKAVRYQFCGAFVRLISCTLCVTSSVISYWGGNTQKVTHPRTTRSTCKKGVCHIRCLLWDTLFRNTKSESHLEFAELLEIHSKGRFPLY